MTTDQFISAVLSGLQLEATPNRIGFFKGLAAAEGTTAKNNPFATTRKINRGETTFNSSGVKNYRTAQDGITATVETFKLGFYNQVRRALRRDAPVSVVAKALSDSPYVGGSQAVKDRHAQNIVTRAQEFGYESPALDGSSEPVYATSASGFTASLGPGADRDEAKTNQKVLDFATAVAQWHGRNLTISTGTRHGQFVKGSQRESEHWQGNAADIPATGEELTKLGQDALIAAGMAPEKARKQTGGVFNVNGYQVLFNTNTGGNHFDHLHVGVGRAEAPPVYATQITAPQQPGAPQPGAPTPVAPAVFPFEDPSFQVPFEEPGSVPIPSPNRNYAETWKLIGSSGYADPDSQTYAELAG